MNSKKVKEELQYYQNKYKGYSNGTEDANSKAYYEGVVHGLNLALSLLHVYSIQNDREG